MKILFLDFDGVINSQQWMWKRAAALVSENTIWHEEGLISHHFDIEAVARINKVLATTGAKVVVSSAWRKSGNLEFVRDLLAIHEFEGEIIDTTPVLYDHDSDNTSVGTLSTLTRGDEITHWLKEHPEVTKYAVIDDAPFTSFISHLEVFVKTRFMHGVKDEHVDQLILLLGKV